MIICLSPASLTNALYVANGLDMANGDYSFLTIARAVSTYSAIGAAVNNDTSFVNSFNAAAQYLKMVGETAVIASSI